MDQRGGETSQQMKRTSTLLKHTGSLQVTVVPQIGLEPTTLGLGNRSSIP